MNEIFSSIINYFTKTIDKYGEMIGLSFNDIFCIFIIMVALYTYYTTNKEASKNIKDINTFSKELKSFEINNEINEKLMLVNEKDILKNNKYLKDLWDKYFDSIRSINYNNKVSDIRTYFNVKTIIEIPGKRKIAEIIPGLLTALGILGTFLGLLKGVTGLNTDNTELLRNSITELISGMSLAFTTSIVGILSSVVWSYMDRKRYKSFIQSINEFYFNFYEVFPIATANSFLNEMLELQKEQTEAIKHMSTDISLELSKTINNDLLPGIDKSIVENIMPSVESISKVIGDFADVATSNQTESINKVVDKFINSMNTALEGQFENLANTINELCKWQIETKESLDGLIEELKETTLNQKEINVSSEEMIKTFSEYFNNLVDASDNLNNNIEQINDLVLVFEQLMNHSKEVAMDLDNKSNTLQERNQKYFNLIEENLDKIQRHWSQTEKSFTDINDKLNDSSKEFSNNLHTGLKITFQDFDENLSTISNRLGGTIEEVQDSVEELPKVISLISKEISNSLEKVKESLDNIPKVIDQTNSNKTTA